MSQESNSPIRCGIVLAGGDGKRLHPLIHRLRGEIIPKQYVNFVGTRSMLEQTFDRAERLIPPDRIFTVVSKGHLGVTGVREQISGRPSGTVILQPENKETGPGLLLPLMHVYKRHHDATVVVFPSDHFILEEDLFMGHVALACRAVERDPSQIVLLGVEPNGPEPEYGYILLDERTDREAPSIVHQVLGFIEKPGSLAAQDLVLRGGLWNTMVMAFRVETLLNLAQKVMPVHYRSFQRILDAVGTPSEMDVVEETYRGIDPVNLSTGFLEVIAIEQPLHLGVLPVRNVFWNDLGSEHRIVSLLKNQGVSPLTPAYGSLDCPLSL
jgi:mannose-1-phosphate guanylyltransferase